LNIFKKSVRIQVLFKSDKNNR